MAQPKGPWTDEKKSGMRGKGIANTDRDVLNFLSGGGAYVADELRAAMKKGRSPYLWDALRKMERDGLVWRAFDYEDWRTLHQWKITGCGRLAALSRS